MNDTENNQQIKQVSVNEIIPNRFQPRKNFDSEQLNELASSIKQYGIIQPLVLRSLGDRFEIIAGERRYKAACMLGLKTVPAIIMTLNDTDAAEIALIENIQRKDLTAIEEAKSYKQILSLGNIKQQELAKKIGKNQSTISNKLRLLNLSLKVQNALLENQISERHARSLLRIKNEKFQEETLDEIIKRRMTVRETDKYIDNLFKENIINEENNDQTDEIIDFDDSNEEKKGDDKMDQNNTNNIPVIDNFTANAGIPNIPDYDQINIATTEQTPAYVNDDVVNSAQVEQPNQFFNYDNASANMNFDNTFNNGNVQIPQYDQININPQPANQPSIESDNNIGGNDMAQNTYNQNTQQEIMGNAPNMMNNNNNIINQVPYNQQMHPQQMNNIMQQPYNPNMPNNMPNNMVYNNMPNNGIPQQPYNPNITNNMMNNMPNNMIYNNMPNNGIPQQPYNPNIPNNMTDNNPNNFEQQKNEIEENQQNLNIESANENYVTQESHTMMMQQDITGAIVVIRNTVMDLQGNGYGLEINEQDLGNLYQIVINIKK